MIELEDWTGKKVYAEYSSFHLESESDGYRLRLGTYQGNAGDSFSSHNGKQFTTLDRDKDAFSGKGNASWLPSALWYLMLNVGVITIDCPSESSWFLMLYHSLLGNCAHFHKGGWWYNACGQTNLNGVWYSGGVYRSKFQDGVFWAEYGGGFYSLKSVRLMIRPIDWNLELGFPSDAPQFPFLSSFTHKQIP